MDNSTESTTLVDEENNSSRGILYALYGVIGVVGVLGNAIVCLVLFFSGKIFGAVTTTLIINQSAMDLVASLFLLGLRLGPTIDSVEEPWFSILCRFWTTEYLMWAAFQSSTFNLVLITIERYFAVCRPIQHHKLFTAKRIKCACVVMWFLGALYNTYWIAIVYSNKPYCYPQWPNLRIQQVFGVIIILVDLVIPTSIMLCSYIKITLELKRRQQMPSASGPVATFSRAKKNVIKTMFIVVISYVVTWTPTEIGYLYYNLGYEYSFVSATHYFLSALVLINMCTNPIIYCLMVEKFRKKLQLIVCRGRGNAIEDSSVVSTIDEPVDVS